MKIALSVVALAALGIGSWFGMQALLAPPPASEEAAAEVAADSLGTDSTQVALAPLADEMEALSARLAVAEAAADSLRQLLDDHRTLTEDAQVDAAALATTLTKMEDADLEAVVQRLDGRSFVQLYEAASSRNQVRLMGSLTPEQAASFIRVQLPGGAARTVSTSLPDSVSAS
ncbi:MAG: hypothetical protein AAF845_01800 [Bacteroidota bacterium]